MREPGVLYVRCEHCRLAPYLSDTGHDGRIEQARCHDASGLNRADEPHARSAEEK